MTSDDNIKQLRVKPGLRVTSCLVDIIYTLIHLSSIVRTANYCAASAMAVNACTLPRGSNTFFRAVLPGTISTALLGEPQAPPPGLQKS